MNGKDWFSYPLRSIKGMHHSLPKIVLDLLSSWVKKRYKRQNLQMRNGLEMNKIHNSRTRIHNCHVGLYASIWNIQAKIYIIN
jgi:hypothetical protein